MDLPVLFGADVDPTWEPVDGPERTALAAERLGLDLLAGGRVRLGWAPARFW